MKSLKKAVINAEGFFDYFHSRFNGVQQMIGGTFAGAFIGAFFGGVIGLIYSAEANLKQEFINDRAEYEQVYAQVEFPSSCDIAEGIVYPAKGPNGQYTLYVNDVAQSARNSERFAEDFKDCMREIQDDPDLLENMTIRLRYDVSQPMRAVNVNDADDTENFRVTKSAEGSEKMSGQDWAALLADYKGGVPQALTGIWRAALDDYEDGQIYNHIDSIDAKDVKIFYYEDDYQPYYWAFPQYGALLLGTFCFFSSGFGASPNSAARTRKENRDARRRALDAKPLDF